MKKLLKISFLLGVLCVAVPVYADGDLPIGNKTCTQNCALYEEPTIPNTSDDTIQNESNTDGIYSWVYQQIAGLIG